MHEHPMDFAAVGFRSTVEYERSDDRKSHFIVHQSLFVDH